MGKLEETLYREIKELAVKLSSCAPEEELALRDMILLNVEVLEEEKPHSIHLDYFQALGFFYDKNYTQALRYTIRALILNPDNKKLYSFLEQIVEKGQGTFSSRASKGCLKNGIYLAEKKAYAPAEACLNAAVELLLDYSSDDINVKKELDLALSSLSRIYLELAKDKYGKSRRVLLGNVLSCLEDVQGLGWENSFEAILEEVKPLIEYTCGEDNYFAGRVEELKRDYQMAFEHYKTALGQFLEEEPQDLSLKLETVFSLIFCREKVKEK